MSTNSQIGEQNAAANYEEFSLKELIIKISEWWRYLWSKKVIIIAFCLMGGILGFVYAYFQKPTYTATTTFVLESGEGGGGSLAQYAGLASMVGIDLGGGGGGIFQGDNILELYKSRAMLQKTLLTTVDINGKSQTLMERFVEFNKLRDNWSDNPDLMKLNFTEADDAKAQILNPKLQRLQDSILGKIVEEINRNYLSVTKPDKKLSIIRVDLRSKDESFAKQFNDEIVKNVNDFYYQTKTKKSADNVTILQAKADSVKAAMSGAIYTAVSISDATPNMNPTRSVQRIAPQQKAQFSAETNKAILGTLIQNLELAKIAMRKEAPLIQKVDEPVYPLKMEKFGKTLSFVAGGIIFGLLTSLYLLMKLIFKTIME